jgi:hypothetical protein
LGGPRVWDHWEDLGIGGRITLRSMGWTGFSWLRIGSNGGLLWTQWWTFSFHKESRIFLDKLSDNQLFKQYSAPWSEWVSKYIIVLSVNICTS